MFYYAIISRMRQITDTIMMIKPSSFRYNEETAANNHYQKRLDMPHDLDVHSTAIYEFKSFVTKLKKKGVNIILIDDKCNSKTPDSIFPNNWVSFHIDGTVVLYPMFAENRRQERRNDILELLVESYNFRINRVKDYTSLEDKSIFLEGTGSMVLDRVNRICYAAISIRTHKEAVINFCKEMKYRPLCFKAKQKTNKGIFDIYHTNVMMCVADEYSIICLDSIHNKKERDLVVDSLESTGKEIIEISESQKCNFAGNMLQVQGDKKYLVMSDSAYYSLSKKQKNQIHKYNSIIHSDLTMIETAGGGSARCMMAEVFLPNKNNGI